MKKLWSALAVLVLIAAAVWFPFRSLRLLFSSAPQTLFQIAPDAPPAAITDPGHARIPIAISGGAFTTLHINQWSEGETHPSLILVNDETKATDVLSTRPINRHRDFDLSRRLKDGHRYSLRLLSLGRDGGRVFLDELTVRVFPNATRFPPLGPLVAALYIAALLFRRSRAPGAETTDAEIAAGAVVMAFLFRWPAFGATFGQPLEGDAIGYRALAQNLSLASPFQNGVREPLFIWIQKAAGLLWGTGDEAFRAVTLVLSLASAGALYYLSLSLSGRRSVAFMTCALAAVGEYVVLDAVRGERNQLFTLLVLLFCCGAVAKRAPSARQEATLGLAGGLLCWTWLAGAPGVVLAYAYRWVGRRVPARAAMAFWIVFLAMTGGFLVQQARFAGDPFRSLNAHVNFYKNAKETGVPSYAGEKTDWARFVLGGQGAIRTGAASVAATAGLLFNPRNPFNKTFLGFHYSEPYSYALYPFLVAGFAFCLWRREFWAPVLFLSFLNLSAYLLDVVRDPRLFVHLAPFFSYFTAVGLAGAARPVRSVFARLTAFIED